MAVPLQRLDLLADPARLLLGIPQTAHDDLFAACGAGPQGFPQAAAIMRDDAARRRQDLRGRTVVFLEPHDQRAGEVALEFEDVADLGAAPAVDRLVVVADAAQVAVALRQQPQPQILREIGVLVLVDQQIAEALLVMPEDLGVLAEQRQIVQQQIAEIGRVYGRETLLIIAIECDGAPVGPVSGVARRNLVGHQAAILPALDNAEQGPRRPAPLVDIRRRDDLFQQTELVVGVENREARREADRLGVAAQDARGERVKRAEPDAVGGAADHRLEPLAHLARRLVGEGDGQHLAGIGAAARQNVREAGGQHAGFSGTGAGQHQHGALHRRDSPRLRLVERCEQRLRSSDAAGRVAAMLVMPT